MEDYLSIGTLIVVTLVFGGSIVGIFVTKKPGWGRFTVSTLLLVLVLFTAILAVLSGALELQVLANVLFAVAGYAGGLITAKTDVKSDA